MRVLVILRQLLPFVVSILRDRRRWIWVGEPAVRSNGFHERRAAALVTTIGELGPTFVKLAQVFAGRADLIPEPYVSALSALTDRVPPVPVEEIEREIVAAFGQPLEVLFERFDRDPIAAASLGQVHRARYQGREIVLKVLRPGVEELVARDLRASGWILEHLERRWDNPHVRGLRSVITEFSRRVGDEMDLRQESVYAGRIAANFAGNRRVRVPRMEQALVSRRVVGMEYIEGTRIDRLDGWLAERRVPARRVIETVIELYIQMMLVDGLFHADPHAGNILVTDDGTIVLLDFGMVVPVSQDIRWHLISTVFAAIRRDADGVVAGFTELGILLPEADREESLALARTLLDVAHTRNTTPERIQLVADEVMHTLYDFPVTLPGEMVYFARAASLIEGLGVRYDPMFNPVLDAAPVAMRMRRQILSSFRDSSAAGPTTADWAEAMGTVLGRVARMVTNAVPEILQLFVPEEPAMRRLERRSSGL
jgi:predicted unusual protein kinase regulating ubiquinone biosynthesis (AarF/ABC1/UbiB family)